MALSGSAGLAGAGGSIGESDVDTRRLSEGVTSGGKLGEAVGAGFGGSYACAAQRHQGEADLHEGRAGTYKVESERHRDEADEAQRMVRKAMEFLERAKESRDATSGGASAIRG